MSPPEAALFVQVAQTGGCTQIVAIIRCVGIVVPSRMGGCAITAVWKSCRSSNGQSIM